jgi:outer membrane protein OmpA-like peptidoglycan-associated protein
MRYTNWKYIPAWVAVTLVLGGAGCATRGYVRSQVASLKADTGRTETELRSGIADAKSAGDQAGAKAADAARDSESARLMALGRVGYHEAERYRVYFPFDGTNPEPSADETLTRAAGEITSHPEYLVEIFGYTDMKGPDAYNMELSRKRAESVRRILAQAAPVQLSRFDAIGFGKGAPSGEVATLGEGADRRQVVVVLVERTAPGGSPNPLANMQERSR